MLNPTFLNKSASYDEKNYILRCDLKDTVIDNNKNFSTGKELRLQKVYRDEIWKKLKSVGISKDDFDDKIVLDLCCGTGFLTYHLLSIAKPKQVTLMDISPSELLEAKKLISNEYPHIDTEFICADVTDTKMPDNKYDIIIGNSFLHHLYDLPKSLKEFQRLLKPGGYFIVIHEPTIAAIPLESGSIINVLRHIQKCHIQQSDSGPNDGKQGADVWLFEQSGVKQILADAGFSSLKLTSWNFFRPIIVSKIGLHLNNNKQTLSISEQILFRISIKLDSLINNILPSRIFGSFTFIVNKPYSIRKNN